MQIILASGSETRAEMFRAAGINVEIVPPRIDESEVKISLRAEGHSPRDQADALAEMKALRISARHPDALVIGGDQVLDLEGQAFDKPENMAEAREHLQKLRGERHDLYSACVIAEGGRSVWRHIGRARLTMRAFSDEFVEDYLRAMGDVIFTTVGGYRIEERGSQLFSRIEGDWFTILGLPMLEIQDYLRVRGVLIE